jgi:hypothetical protein
MELRRGTGVDPGRAGARKVSAMATFCTAHNDELSIGRTTGPVAAPVAFFAPVPGHEHVRAEVAGVKFVIQVLGADVSPAQSPTKLFDAGVRLHRRRD